MDDREAAGLRGEARQLLSEAAAFVVATKLDAEESAVDADGAQGAAAVHRAGVEPADLDRMLDEVAGLEARMSAALPDDDAVLGRVRVTLGALYATRCLRFGWTAEDRAEAVRLLRKARAQGHLLAEDDASVMLLFAVLLLPRETVVAPPAPLGVLAPILGIARQLQEGGRLVADLHEMHELLDEIVVVRPDDPRIPPLMAFAETLSRILGLVTEVASGRTVPMTRLGELISGMPTAPSGQIGSILGTLMDYGESLEAHQARRPPSPASEPPTPEAPAKVDQTVWDDLAMIVEMSAPGAMSAEELTALIERYEADTADEARSLGVATLGRLTVAMRTNDLQETGKALRNVRAMADAPDSEHMSWLLRAVFPGVLAASAASHGNRQDAVKAVELLRGWPRMPDDGEPPTHEFGFDDLGIGRSMLDHHLRFFQAWDLDDTPALENLLEELTEVADTADPATEWHFLIPLQLAIAEISLAVRRQDTDLLLRAKAHMRSALEGPVPAAGRPLMEAAWSSVLMVAAVLEGRPADLAQATALARDAWPSAPAPHDQRVAAHASIAAGFMAQYHLAEGPARSEALREAIQELEQAAAAITERTAPDFRSRVLWALAEAYRTRRDAGLDDNVRAVALTLDSLRVIAEDVLLQLGTEHGLQSARSGASRGLQAAGWALDEDRVEAAVEGLELGRALVLRAAAAAGTVPDRLRGVGAAELAEAWENAQVRTSADDHFSLPSELRRRALDTLREQEASLAVDSRSHGMFATPDLAQIADALDRAGLDALVYLLPDSDSSEGRVLIIRRDGAHHTLPLPGFSAEGPGPFGRYLDHSARRSPWPHRDADPAFDVAPRWEQSLDELCDRAGAAVLDPLIHILPIDPTPEAPGRVVLVPCGTLGIVPWHAARLSTAPSDVGMDRPVRACDLLVVSYAASAGELLRSLGREREPYDTDPVLVVDPSRTLRYPGAEAAAIRSAYLPHARLLGSIEGHETAGPGTPAEILALLTGDEGKPPASMVQISAHGSASTRPTTSRIRLATPPPSASVSAPTAPPRSAQVGPEYLTVAEILDAPRPAQAGRFTPLVVLDCCETDLSSRDHDEALTLTTAFVARGAADVIGSRWAINDWSTAVCMVVFHHYLATDGLTPAEALRAAQRWMLGPDREPIPALTGAPGLHRAGIALHTVAAWAPFIHQGNADA
ncbi:CHAT domain-containing protein [Catenulispora subtropica]|uniref:CHAT domain-containing protein n=1 Tax=Catenulispora subtropica TaxID=450798 RepID=A0ABP5BRG6_9ACTN